MSGEAEANHRGHRQPGGTAHYQYVNRHPNAVARRDPAGLDNEREILRRVQNLQPRRAVTIRQPNVAAMDVTVGAWMKMKPHRQSGLPPPLKVIAPKDLGSARFEAPCAWDEPRRKGPGNPGMPATKTILPC